MMSEYHNDRLRQLVEQWEKLQSEKQDLSDAQKDILSEAKAVGFDSAVVKQVIKLRKMDPDKRKEQEALLELYKAELGMS